MPKFKVGELVRRDYFCMDTLFDGEMGIITKLTEKGWNRGGTFAEVHWYKSNRKTLEKLSSIERKSRCQSLK